MFAKRFFHVCAGAAVGLTLLLTLAGCTAVGYGVGAGADVLRNGSSRERLVRLPRGSKIRLWLRDGQVLGGYYEGLGCFDERTYQRLFADWARVDSAAAAGLPGLGDSIRLERKNETRAAGRFAGFALDGIRFRPHRASVEEIPFSSFEVLRALDGRSWMRDDFRALALADRLPLSTAVRLDTLNMGNGIREVQWIEIQRIAAPAPRGGRSFGALVGLIVDLAVIIGLSSSHGDMWGN